MGIISKDFEAAEQSRKDVAGKLWSIEISTQELSGKIQFLLSKLSGNNDSFSLPKGIEINSEMESAFKVAFKELEGLPGTELRLAIQSLKIPLNAPTETFYEWILKVRNTEFSQLVKEANCYKEKKIIAEGEHQQRQHSKVLLTYRKTEWNTMLNCARGSTIDTQSIQNAYSAWQRHRFNLNTMAGIYQKLQHIMDQTNASIYALADCAQGGANRENHAYHIECNKEKSDQLKICKTIMDQLQANIIELVAQGDQTTEASFPSN